MTWQPQYFQSGTCIVTDNTAGPWLYVCMTNPTDLENQRDRMLACEQLADFLNGGTRPAWLDDMRRPKEDEIIGADGASIRATGPMYDRDPPNLNWDERDDDEAKNARARLIDRLWLNRT